METITNTHSQVAATTSRVNSNREYTAVFKKIAISAVAGAVALSAIAVAAQRSSADRLVEPETKFTVSQRAAAAQVLRQYPMPGDPHDAEASFNELYKAVMGASGIDAPEDALAEPAAKRDWKIDISQLSPAARILRQYPMPGDPHDAEASFSELFGAETAGLKVSAAVTEPEAQRPPLTPAVVLPRPGDPHDDLYTQ
jgi:hypothetical protein